MQQPNLERLSERVVSGAGCNGSYHAFASHRNENTKREPSEAPVKVTQAVTGVKPDNEAQKPKVSQEIHWAYGTAWGVARGLIGLTGLKGIPAALVHFGAIWGASMVMLPHFDAAPPVYDEEPGAIAIDGLHHAVYAATASLVYSTLD